MSNQETKQQFESLEEPAKIEGNYYKVDLFVSSALIFFAILIIYLEKSLNWTILLIFIALLFLLRGIKNWKRKRAGTQHVED
jgi:di/tricarboxylate transporter